MASNSFLGVFAKSPLKPLEEHINVVCECSKLLQPFFDSAFDDNLEDAKHNLQLISATEKRADEIKRTLRTSLPHGLFLPINRQDLLDLLTHQDSIANLSKDIAERVFGRQLPVPEAIKIQFKAYLQRSLDATEQARLVINEMDDLLETGFSGREVQLVETMIDQLDLIEDDSDDMQVALRAELWAIEKQLNPIDVMFLYDVIDAIGGLADAAERVGSRLELMLAR